MKERLKRIKYYCIPKDLPEGIYKCKLRIRNNKKTLTVYIKEEKDQK